MLSPSLDVYIHCLDLMFSLKNAPEVVLWLWDRCEQEVLVRDDEGHARCGPGGGGGAAAVSSRREKLPQRHFQPLHPAVQGHTHRCGAAHTEQHAHDVKLPNSMTVTHLSFCLLCPDREGCETPLTLPVWQHLLRQRGACGLPVCSSHSPVPPRSTSAKPALPLWPAGPQSRGGLG